MFYSLKFLYFFFIEFLDFIFWFNNLNGILCYILFIYGMRIMFFILIIFKEDICGLSLI